MPYTVIGGIGEVIPTSNTTMHNKCNILTLNNVVMLCDNVTITNYGAGSTFLKLSDEAFYPATAIHIPVVVNTELTYLYIDTMGEFRLPKSYDSATVYLNGILFSVNSKYYTPEIGNIYDNGTSPLSSAEV